MEHIRRSLSDLLTHARKQFCANERQQSPRRVTRYTYTQGPMVYIGQKIVRKMQDAGYPAKIYDTFRHPDVQYEKKKMGRSKAGPFQSPHQFYEAVDIAHPTLAWSVSDEYWDALAMASRAVAADLKVKLELGYDWGWDMAHIEIQDWRDVRERNGKKIPTQSQLDARFQELLPSVWKQYTKSKQYQSRLKS